MAYQQGFSLEEVVALKAELADFDVNLPVTLPPNSAALASYFRTYDFDRVLLLPEVNFYLGYQNCDDSRVATYYWSQPKPRATVLVCTGLFDHVGLFLAPIKALLDNGYEVLALDWPGHGLSDGDPIVVDNFDRYSRVLSDLLSQWQAQLQGLVKSSQARDVNVPVYALSQSTGGAALMNYLLLHSGGDVLSKAIFLAPLLRIRSWSKVSWTHRLLHKFVSHVPRTFSNGSHDVYFNHFLSQHCPLQARKIPVQWVGALREWDRRFDSLPESEFPLLIVQGDEDNTVLWRENLPRIQSKFPNAKVSLLSGGRHHLVNEDNTRLQSVITQVIRHFDAT